MINESSERRLLDTTWCHKSLVVNVNSIFCTSLFLILEAGEWNQEFPVMWLYTTPQNFLSNWWSAAWVPSPTVARKFTKSTKIKKKKIPKTLSSWSCDYKMCPRNAPQNFFSICCSAAWVPFVPLLLILSMCQIGIIQFWKLYLLTLIICSIGVWANFAWDLDVTLKKQHYTPCC